MDGWKGGKRGAPRDVKKKKKKGRTRTGVLQRRLDTGKHAKTNTTNLHTTYYILLLTTYYKFDLFSRYQLQHKLTGEESRHSLFRIK